MDEHKYPGFQSMIGRKFKPCYISNARRHEDGILSIEVYCLSCDPLVAHFTPDGTILYISGGGCLVTKERNGETITECAFADVDRASIREEISRFLEE